MRYPRRYETAFFGQVGDGVMTEDKLEPIFVLLGIPYTKQAARVSVFDQAPLF